MIGQGWEQARGALRGEVARGLHGGRVEPVLLAGDLERVGVVARSGMTDPVDALAELVAVAATLGPRRARLALPVAFPEERAAVVLVADVERHLDGLVEQQTRTAALRRHGRTWWRALPDREDMVQPLRALAAAVGGERMAPRDDDDRRRRMALLLQGGVRCRATEAWAARCSPLG